MTDPPHDMCTLMRFAVEQEAKDFLKVAGPHSYILNPQTDKSRGD